MDGYSDWLESEHSARVWLDHAMMALCQFATIKPIRKDKTYNGRNFKEYNYGIYTESQSGDIKYLSTTHVSHRNLQSKFREILEEGVSPCEILWEVRRSLSDYGDWYIYTFVPLYSKGWIEERDRPALFGDINTWEI
jgi:hypothetical protein